jgi:hypothetical protein
MQALPCDNGSDQGQLLAAADRWRTDRTQHELGMLVEVRGGANRCFSAPQSPICCSISPPALLCLEPSARRRRHLPGPCCAQQAVRSGRCADLLTSRVPTRLIVCFWLACRLGMEVRAAPSSRSSAASWRCPSPTLRIRYAQQAVRSGRYACRNCLFATLHDMLYHCGCSQGKRAETERVSRALCHELRRGRTATRRTRRRQKRCLSAPSQVHSGVRKTMALKIQPLTCGFSWPVLISAIFSNMSSSFVLLEQLDFGAVCHTHVGAHENQQVVLATGMLRPNSSPYI